MKFPSLIRLPKNKKFNVKPRHYDPIKDDIDPVSYTHLRAHET